MCFEGGEQRGERRGGTPPDGRCPTTAHGRAPTTAHGRAFRRPGRNRSGAPPLAALEALLRSSSSLPAPGRADRKRRAPPSTAASTTPTTAPAASSEGEGRLLLLLRRQVAKGEAAGRRVGREVLVLVLLLTKVRLEDLHRLRGG